ncbi:acyl-CoA thioester hydrolase [Kineococcus xinjiangensis]|uniref:Acyl-CoA thioester hydrolase n=1 Tax=Kineococcus xinjiangensis TaxID=512762 RepID=A0A2S6IUW0_9ACTN|nr:thioesterase family protein [Kineococcus xinjiangensis]PPK97969.1 acyl-CoA thioester hydrolase [Kineococcus xinjiangensis]
MARQRLLISLRWADMDAYRHVNNVELLRILEEARVRVFSQPLGRGGDSMLGTGMVVARHEVEYLASLDYRPEPVAVDLWVHAVGGASFDVGYEVLEPDGGPVYLRATTSLVSYDFTTGRPRRLDDEQRAALEGLRDAPPVLRRGGRRPEAAADAGPAAG